MHLSYVLVPHSVPSATVLESSVCHGALDIPGQGGKCTLFVLEGTSHVEAGWYDERNVVLTVTSNVLLSSSPLERVAISAALDAKRGREKPPAMTVQ